MERDNLKISNISEQQWLKYYEQLLTKDQPEETTFADFSDCVDLITMDELLAALHCCKNSKAPGSDGLKVELIKCVPALLHDRLLQFINLCLSLIHI